MGQYVVNEHKGSYMFNLCASNGHVLAGSIVFPDKEECLDAIDTLGKVAPKASVEDTTEFSYTRVASPKYRIYKTLEGKYYFRFFAADGADVVRSHNYEKKESLLRRIERMREEATSSLAHDVE